jgi:hypothetical protein
VHVKVYYGDIRFLIDMQQGTRFSIGSTSKEVRTVEVVGEWAKTVRRPACPEEPFEEDACGVLLRATASHSDASRRASPPVGPS